MGIFGGSVPKLLDRLGTIDVLPSTQSTAVLCWHLVKQDEGPDLVLLPEQWRAYQAECGICWACGDQLPTGARYCIACRAEMPPAMGDTERLYVPPAIGKTERL